MCVPDQDFLDSLTVGGKEPDDKTNVTMVELYGFCLSIAYIVHRRHPYIEGLPTL